MLYGRQRAEWDQTAAMIVHFRRALGDQKTQFEAVHPHYAEVVRAEHRNIFKRLSRDAQAAQQAVKEREK